MASATAFNVAGLIANLVVVILLFRYGMPFRVRTGGFSSYVTENSDPKEVRAERWYDVLGGVGLVLIVLGTIAQIVGAIIG
jgi:hypothetical protein